MATRIPFTRRRAYVADRGFIFGAYRSALREYVEWAWGWDEDFQRTGFWRHHPIEQLQVLLVDGQRAGALHVEDRDTCCYLKTIFLLGEYQGQGIGARLVTAELLRARARGQSLALRVIKVNPARRLYERLGFETVADEDVTYLMRAA